MKNQETTTVSFGLFGGEKVCKNCGQKKTIWSSYACSTGKPHVWVNA